MNFLLYLGGTLLAISMSIALAQRLRPAPILLYHFIDGEGDKRGLSVSLSTLEKQIVFLLKHNFRVIPFQDLVESLRDGQRVSADAVVITFDDGDDAFYTKVYPILLKYRLPATIFVIAGWIGKPGYLNWDQLRAMSSDLVTVGSHSVTHRYLPDLSLEEVRTELSESKRILEEGIRRPVYFFSYPVGGFGPEIERLVSETGYLAACTTNRGRNFFQRDLWALKRVKMTENSNQSAVLWAKLSGFYPVPSEIFPKDPGTKEQYQ